MSVPAPERVPDERVLPRPVPRVRRAVSVFAVVVALGVAVPIAAGVVTLPVRSVQISGEFFRVSEADIERAVVPLLVSGLLRVDIEALRRAALAVPGVREATVRRVWPDRVEIFVIERVAIARWARGGLIEVDGTHFYPMAGDGPAGALPLLTGPEGSEQRVLDLHLALDRILVPLGMTSVATELTPRGVLYATLEGGARLVMRPETVASAARTWAKVLAGVMVGRLHEVERVDFRYPGGFAVRMRPGAAAAGAQS
ncbi:MAG: FtsQ-type POTRA domain-containing protein [Thiotrichales bacterium]|nr:FtsQ-type POTRA domain-containing protein [Thiotrichales bacterium]